MPFKIRPWDRGLRYLIGIKYGQFQAKLNEYSPTLSIKLRGKQFHVNQMVGFYNAIRPVSPGTGEMQASAIIHDQKDARNKISSMMHRFARDMPVPDGPTVRDFRDYAKALIEKLFEPVQASELRTFKQWMDHTHYSPAQKKYLTDLRQKITRLSENMVSNDSFIKWEAYTAMGKLCRSINSYSDESKAVLGPLFHSIDKKTFRTKYFVKGIDPLARPEMLKKTFGARPVMGTDFSSFEAHHSGVFAEVTRHWAMHMVRGLNLPRHLNMMISRMFLGRNVCNMGDVVGEVDQRLMSGALWTSSANGVLNLCILSYLNTRAMYPNITIAEAVSKHDECFQGYVEGDDGICLDRFIPDDLIRRLGIVLKFDHFINYGEASFCGIVCDDVVGVNLSDPMKFMSKFFVMPPKYATARVAVQNAYLRAKALSYKYALNDCPIIGVVCHEVCRLTKNADPRRANADVDSYRVELLEKAIEAKIWRREPNVRAESRLLMERVYGITVSEQMRIESAFRDAREGKPIEVELAHLLAPLHLEHASSHVSPVEPVHLPVPLRRHLRADDPVEIVYVDRALNGSRGAHAKRACNVYKAQLGTLIPPDATAWE